MPQARQDFFRQSSYSLRLQFAFASGQFGAEDFGRLGRVSDCRITLN